MENVRKEEVYGIVDVGYMMDEVQRLTNT